MKKSSKSKSVKPKSALSKLIAKPIDDSPHLVIIARAGTGKTTTLIEGLKKLKGVASEHPAALNPSPQQVAIWDELQRSPEASSVCFVAFNKSIATELQQRVPTGCTAMTMHSMGFKMVTNTFGKVEVNKYRTKNILAKLLGADKSELQFSQLQLVNVVDSLVSLCKNTLTGPRRNEIWTIEQWQNAIENLIYLYGIETDQPLAMLSNLVAQVLNESKNICIDRCIDYNDMIWLPVVLNLYAVAYDILLIDEAQDLTRCQQELAIKVGKRLILCGDPKQAIYGFAGADSGSIDRMTTLLKENEYSCIVLPLNVTRRCGKAIVKEAQRIVPDFEAHENNSAGNVSHASLINRTDGKQSPDYTAMVTDGDMIVCRNNGPLVSQCFRFLKMGRKAQIQGRDIGQGLISTINKQKATTVPELIERLNLWMHHEIKKEEAKKHVSESRIQSLEDRVECTNVFCQDAKTIDEVIKKIETLYTDNQELVGIRLSSIHKAKGLEANRVFFLRPKGAECPSPRAKTAMAIDQEKNLAYVAITRAISELIYVS